MYSPFLCMDLVLHVNTLHFRLPVFQQEAVWMMQTRDNLRTSHNDQGVSPENNDWFGHKQPTTPGLSVFALTVPNRALPPGCIYAMATSLLLTSSAAVSSCDVGDPLAILMAGLGMPQSTLFCKLLLKILASASVGSAAVTGFATSCSCKPSWHCVISV